MIQLVVRNKIKKFDAFLLCRTMLVTTTLCLFDVMLHLLYYTESASIKKKKLERRSPNERVSETLRGGSFDADTR